MRHTGKIVLAALVSVNLIGCTNIQNDNTRTKTEASLLGGGVGAALGAGIGAIAGGNGKSALIGAAIGAGIGSLGGFLAGKHIADKKAEYASQEAWLDDCIAYSQNVNEETATYNAQLNKDVQALDKQSATLVAQYKSKQATRSKLIAEQNNVKKLHTDTSNNIAKLEENLIKQKGIAQEAKASGKAAQARQLDAEIAKLDKQIKDMKAYNKKLANISVRLAV